MKKVFLLLIGAVILWSCAPKVTNNPMRKIPLENIIEKDTFEIFSEFAIPLRTSSTVKLLPIGNQTGQINLMDNDNYFRKMGDFISIDLPYFGEQQISSTYGGNTQNNIIYDGVPKLIEHEYNERRATHIYDIEIDNGIERFNVVVTLYQNLFTRIKITSSHRTSITYTGKIVE